MIWVGAGCCVKSVQPQVSLGVILYSYCSGKLAVFTVLCEQYQPSLRRDPMYNEVSSCTWLRLPTWAAAWRREHSGQPQLGPVVGRCSPADLLPCFLQYLDRIGQLFFGVPPKQTSSYGGLLGEPCGLVLDRWLPSVLSNLLLKSVPQQLRLSTEHHLMGLNSKYEHLPSKAGQGQCSVVLWAF